MALDATTLARHELVGLAVEVVDATDAGRVDTAGRVVAETERTLTVATGDGERVVPKVGATFAFDVPGTEHAPASWPVEPSGPTATPARDAAGETVAVDGDVLVRRPARRTTNGVRPTWH